MSQFWFTVIDSCDIDTETREYRGIIPLSMHAHEYCLLEEHINLPHTDELCDNLGNRFDNFTDTFEDPVVVVNFNAEANPVNVSAVMRKQYKLKYKRICRKGFTIGDTHYKYMLTSGSALKDQQIWFYNTNVGMPRMYYGANMERFAKKKTSVKVNMYMGLMLSSCAPWRNFPVNRVCCLPDHKIKIDTECMFVDDDAGVNLTIETLPINTHDGMGFIRERAMPEEVESTGGGVFQFRGPWVKGLLRKLPERYWHGTYTDVWGNEVNLEDMDVIFTDSVFKGACGYDSMKDYISNAPKFGYVIPSFRRRKFNYQILYPLGLSYDELKEIASEDLEYFHGLIDCEEETNWPLINIAIRSLVLQNAEALDVGALRGAMSDYLKGKKKEILSYHFNTRKYKSYNAYLQSDPDYYFTSFGELASDEVCDKRFEDGELVAIARNPQVSVSEWVLARNHITSNAVLGAVDLPANSPFAQTLSGADFDGDQVLVTNHPVIINALSDENRYLYKGVDIRCKPIMFNTPEINHVSWLDAAWSEMQNFEFSTAANNGTRAYVSFGSDTTTGIYYGVVFSAMMQVGVDAGKYQYIMPDKWNDIKKEFIRKKKSFPLCAAAFFGKDDRENRDSYIGIIANDFHTWYEVRANEVLLDTVYRDEEGTPVKQKKYIPKKCSDSVIERELEVIQNNWELEKMSYELEMAKGEARFKALYMDDASYEFGRQD